ncbi:MAG: hypothetical protein RLZZ78_730 [Armatimonadota bacterium]|jgi:restriction system protein
MDKTLYGQVHTLYTRSGLVSYSVDITHPGLAKHRTIKAPNVPLLQQLATNEGDKWNSTWLLQQQKLSEVKAKQAGNDTASRRTQEALALMNNISTTLAQTLKRNDAINWDELKRRLQYPEPAPKIVPTPTRPVMREPQLSLMDKVIPGRKDQLLKRAYTENELAVQAWQASVSDIQRQNTENSEAFAKRKQQYVDEVNSHNQSVDELRRDYLSCNQATIELYVDLVLTRSTYPDFMPNNWTGAYLPESRGFVLDFELPAIDRFPTLQEVKFVATRSEFTEKHITEKNAAKLYDDFIYQVALRTIHELFESDVASAIDFVVFNGIVNSINKATGQEQSACIATVQVDKPTFLAINLSAIEPKTCFKQLKGVSASTLSSLTPVAPLMRMDTSDKRFVESKDIASNIDDSTNLAAMNWEDFEHLVRELFAKEFTSSGSEVRVTRASRDGGVDAIAFDPDPIRGGKIVIQAKRYTNLVDVSAVRDLYGTVMNEGATKGILVTTSDFGPDAYAFANGKPISLLNGANLLHLLERHGRKAYIDVKEAKILNAQQSSGDR